MPELNNEAKQLLVQFQIQSQQLENIINQKQTIIFQKNEIENALEELNKHGENFYKIVGPLVVKSSKDDLKKELENKKEEDELKIKSLEKSEKEMKKIIDSNREKLRRILPTIGAM
ncbi:MAG: prefoldin subunit [Candidatus Aenigmarchaeota archaeon]|nr:prefoldin subunit [Candidatus Aenigmarchaeota archaeon]